MVVKKILVVEDNEDCRELLVIQLRRMNYQVIEAGSGEQGVRKALEEPPDLIVMDIGLPGISGIEATIKLKAEPATKHIPVVAFTAWQEEAYKSRAKKAGIEAFLTKPTAFQVIKETLQKILPTDSLEQASLESPSG